jgi:phosphoglycerate dehydrogenase-like enzyme
MDVAFLCNRPDAVDLVFPPQFRHRLASCAQLRPGVLTVAEVESAGDSLAGIEAVFSTWGMPRLTSDQLDRLPNLRAVFYGASSVKNFAPPLLERGITVVSAWSANAIPVAEFALAQILLGLKGYFRNTAACRAGAWSRGAKPLHGDGAFGATVALLGYGQVARHLRRFLALHQITVLVVDPTLSDDEARRDEVERVDLAEAFRCATVVSNHLPALESTRQVITGDLLRRLPPGGVFINTGRGMSVAEAELVAVATARSDLTFLLDVTDPEPPPADSPLHGLPNIHLSSHIAGSLGRECHRMAERLLEEFLAWREGRPLRHAVSAAMLPVLA